jgi:two-component system alkaline phosphatase synthesis response regulator PhoP
MSKTKILIAEDDKFIGDVYETKLSSEGFDVTLAVNGAEALEKIKKETPELILLDIFMPELDGMGFLKKVKEDEDLKEYKNIPIIILTNASERDYVAKALDLGAVDYMVKSNFTPDEVIGKVRKYIK